MLKFLFILLFCPAIAQAEPCAETISGIVENENGSYFISAIVCNGEYGVVDKMNKKAEEYCITQGLYFVFIESSNIILTSSTYNSKLTFKCISDKDEAERLRRIHELRYGTYK